MPARAGPPLYPPPTHPHPPHTSALRCSRAGLPDEGRPLGVGTQGGAAAQHPQRALGTRDGHVQPPDVVHKACLQSRGGGGGGALQ